MTSPYLPDDCIHCILQYLQNYHSTLFNCLLVNRFWCQATIPLLYTNPFVEDNYSIISTLILCFNKTEILQLKNQLNLLDIHDIEFDIEYKPSFEYLKYIENYNYKIITFMISRWVESYLKLSHDQYIGIQKNFIPIFHQSILLQCNNIKQLNVESFLFDKENCNIHFIKSFTSNLSKLIVLSLNICTIHEMVLEFLNNVENTCLNLGGFEIQVSLDLTDTIKEKLCTVIQKQNHLKVLKISCYKYMYLLNDILLSCFQKHSLVYIEFKNLDFDRISFKDFINIYNLKCIKFCKCGGISLDQCEVLEFASFELRELNFRYNLWDYDISILMIKYLGASLWRLLLSANDLVIPTIENILIYCSNLVTLDITIISNVDLLIFPYFKNLKIRRLNITFLIGNDENNICANLANNLPITVKEVSISFISFSQHFNILQFEKFLDNCHDYLEVINLDCNADLELLKIILNYTERNNYNLKILGIMVLEKDLSDDETNLLDKIKNKGVKLVSKI